MLVFQLTKHQFCKKKNLLFEHNTPSAVDPDDPEPCKADAEVESTFGTSLCHDIHRYIV